MAIYPIDAGIEDRQPDRGYSISKRTNSTRFSSSLGYEKTKLRSRRQLRTFTFTYSNINDTIKENIESFYEARGGDFESFNLSLSHFNLSGTTIVRFGGDLVVDHVISGNDSNFYTITLTMVEV
jgi:hypothetical protein